MSNGPIVAIAILYRIAILSRQADCRHSRQKLIKVIAPSSTPFVTPPPFVIMMETLLIAAIVSSIDQPARSNGGRASAERDT